MESTEKKEINILHLSDLHFGLEPKKNEIGAPVFEKVCSFFLKNIVDELNSRQLKVDYIIVTGDIANSALEEEYNMAYAFFCSLKELFNESEILFVPGNHDKKRYEEYHKVEKFNSYNILEECFYKQDDYEIDQLIKTIDDINEKLEDQANVEDEESKKCLNLKLEEEKAKLPNLKRIKDTHANIFKSFSKKLLIEKLASTKNEYDKTLNLVFESARSINQFGERNFGEYIKFITQFNSHLEDKFIPIEVKKKKVNSKITGIYNFPEVIFVLLNTAWWCQNSKQDPGKLTLGKQIIESVEEALNRINPLGDKLVISLMHHCPNSFQRNDILDRGYQHSNLSKISECSKIILSGHEHSSHLEKPDFIDNEVQLLSTGTFYTGRNEVYSCAHYKINDKKDEILIHNISMSNKTSPEGEYLWKIDETKDSLNLPLTIPQELMDEKIKLETENDRLNWLYGKLKNH
jgi:predicted MPP superfamily phosphohydrolase